MARGGGPVVLAAASDSERVADLTSPWWNDRWRFAGIAVLAFAPLAAYGLHVLAVAADALLRRVMGRRYAGAGDATTPGERRHGRRHRGGRLRTGRQCGHPEPGTSAGRRRVSPRSSCCPAACT